MREPARRSRRTFDALHIRDYRWYWLGTLASFFGMQMQMLAQSWLAYELTHSPFKLGLVSAAWGLPMLLFSLLSGVIIDRVQKRSLLMACQACMGVITLALAILITTGFIQYWHLLAASLLVGIAFSFNLPGRLAIVPEIVPRDNLYNAIALSSGAANLARVAGPALAGVLIGVSGTAGAYYCALVCYGVASASLFMLPATSKVSFRPGRSIMQDLMEGLQYLRDHSIILTVLAMEFVFAVFGMPYQSLMPVFAELLEVKALGYGFLMAMVGIGALFGSLVIASLGNFRRKGRLLLLAGITFGIMLVIFANTPSLGTALNMGSSTFYLALFLLVLVGITSTGYTSTSVTVIQIYISDEVRGRVISVYGTVIGLFPVGVLLTGAIAETQGAPFAVTVGGVLLAGFMLIMVFASHRIRHLE